MGNSRYSIDYLQMGDGNIVQICTIGYEYPALGQTKCCKVIMDSFKIKWCVCTSPTTNCVCVLYSSSLKTFFTPHPGDSREKN